MPFCYHWWTLKYIRENVMLKYYDEMYFYTFGFGQFSKYDFSSLKCWPYRQLATMFLPWNNLYLISHNALSYIRQTVSYKRWTYIGIHRDIHWASYITFVIKICELNYEWDPLYSNMKREKRLMVIFHFPWDSIVASTRFNFQFSSILHH